MADGGARYGIYFNLKFGAGGNRSLTVAARKRDKPSRDRQGAVADADDNTPIMNAYRDALDEALAVLGSLKELEAALDLAAACCMEALAAGHKLLLCGNGGSAAQAQHLAGELVGRYTVNRRPLPAIALAADTSVLTCVANDFGYEQVFARQVAALASAGDVLVALSTSGNAPNVLAALETAKSLGIRSVALLGSNGGRAKELADCPVVVRHPKTARVQEAHQFLIHCLMDQMEAAMATTSASVRSNRNDPTDFLPIILVLGAELLLHETFFDLPFHLEGEENHQKTIRHCTLP